MAEAVEKIFHFYGRNVDLQQLMKLLQIATELGHLGIGVVACRGDDRRGGGAGCRRAGEEAGPCERQQMVEAVDAQLNGAVAREGRGAAHLKVQHQQTRFGDRFEGHETRLESGAQYLQPENRLVFDRMRAAPVRLWCRRAT